MGDFSFGSVKYHPSASAGGNFPTDADILGYEEGLDVGYRSYYRDSTLNPLFPFGFGLSYTTFEIQNAHAPSPLVVMSEGLEGQFSLSCSVQNTGGKPGKTAVQFYIQFPPNIHGFNSTSEGTEDLPQGIPARGRDRFRASDSR